MTDLNFIVSNNDSRIKNFYFNKSKNLYEEIMTKKLDRYGLHMGNVPILMIEID